MRKTVVSVVVPENRWFLRHALDEIQRLRNILCLEHARSCAMLRANVKCDCGLQTEAQSALVLAWIAQAEKTRVESEKTRLEALVVHNQREIARLDGMLAQERAARYARGTEPQPVQAAKPESAPAPRTRTRRKRARAAGVMLAAAFMSFAGCRAPFTVMRTTHEGETDGGLKAWSVVLPESDKQSPGSMPAPLPTHPA